MQTRSCRHVRRNLPTALFALVAALDASAGPPEYAVELLGPATIIGDINAGGDVVGLNIDPMSGEIRGFVGGPSGSYQLLPLPPGYLKSRANDINDAGVIVGAVATLGYPNEHGDGAVWTPDGDGGYDVEVLGHLPGHTGSVATAVNNRGDIIGSSIFDNSGFGPAVWFNAPGGILNLQALGAPNMPTDINDHGLMVGFAAPPFDIDTLETVPFPPGMLGGTALHSVNNNGEFAGYVVTSSNSRFAVRYTHQLGWEQLGPTGNASAEIAAYDINDDAVTVGTFGVHFDEFGTVPVSSLFAPDFINWGTCSCMGMFVNDDRQMAVIGSNGSSFESGVTLLTPLGEMIIPGDVNGDAVVNLDDLCAWVQAPIDLNDDGVADESDEQWLVGRLVELGFTVADCNGSGTYDHCDILDGLSQDCDEDGVPDECQPDCNGDGLPDACEPDCNGNGHPDPCDIAEHASLDCNGNGVPDECDGGGVAETLNVFDPPLELVEDAVVLDDLLVTAVGVIEDVDFTIDLDYRIGYLTVLLSHGGTTITLIERPGHPETFLGNGQLGYDIVLDDEGTGGPIEDEGNFGPPFEPITSPPSYTPNELLRAFDGMPAEGIWTVHVVTEPEGSPTGTFTEWGLNITLAAVPVGPCGDVTGDGLVNVEDLVAVILSWGPCAGCPADLDGNGLVDVEDLVTVLLGWDP